MSAKLELIQEGGELEVDETRVIVCPFCEEDWELQGRPSVWRPSRSLSLTRNTEGLLYVCHRATCSRGNKGGFISSRSSLDYYGSAKKKTAKKPKPFQWDTEHLPDRVRTFLTKKFWLRFREHMDKQGFKWSSDVGRIIMPIFDIRGYQIGVNARFYEELEPERAPQTKAIAYWDTHEVPKIHFPKRIAYDTNRPLYIVEDQLSAIKVNDYAQCAALLGTNLSPEVVQHLVDIGFTDIRLMLDADATLKAINYKKKYNLYFWNFSVIVLSNKDPKDMEEGELLEVLS